MNKFSTIFALAFMLVFSTAASAALITSTGTKPSVGNGNKNNPYEIRTAEELRWFVHYENTRHFFPNDYAKLMSDIDLSSICGPDKGSWIPLGHSEEDGAMGYFDGKFYGEGHKITGLYIDGNDFSSDAPIGFIGRSESSRIYKLTIEGEIKNPTKYTGGLCGQCTLGTHMVNCISRVNFSGELNPEYNVGGILGFTFANFQYIHKSVYDGDMSGLSTIGKYVGGLIGNLSTGQSYSIDYCSSNTRCGAPLIGYYKDDVTKTLRTFYCITDGKIIGSIRVETFEGEDTAPVLSYTYYCDDVPYVVDYSFFGYKPTINKCKRITREELTNGKACYDMNQLTTDVKFYQNIGETPNNDGTPLPESDHGIVYQIKTYTDCTNYTVSYDNVGMDNTEHRTHIYSESDAVCSKCHTAVNPDYGVTKDADGYYLLSNAGEMRWFVNLVNESGVTDAKARITADIAMDEAQLAPLTIFSGEIDGQGHSISNLDIKACNQYGGLVAQLKSGGSIHDLTISGSVTANNCYYVGGFAGLVENGASLYNLRNDCKVENNVFAMYTASSYLGGIAGLVRGSIHNCINNGTVIDTSSYYNGTYCIAGVAGRIASDGTFSYLVNNAAVGSQGLRQAYGAAVANYSNTTNPTGIYYVEIDNPGVSYFFSNTKATGATAISDRRQVGSGELCYLLNNSNAEVSDIRFGQKIGVDLVPYPYLTAEHPKVYNQPYYNCTFTYDYSNYEDGQGTKKDNHEYNSDGFCIHCCHADVPQDENSIYQISSAEEWNKFVKALNQADKDGLPARFASAALTTDLAASSLTPVEWLRGNLYGQGHNITLSDAVNSFNLIENAYSSASVRNLNVTFKGLSNTLIKYNDGHMVACSVVGGQFFADDPGTISDCYTDQAIKITSRGKLLRCLQCVETDGVKKYTVLSKTFATEECSLKAEFSQAQEETGELAYYLSHIDKNQPCVWGQLLGTDSHPKPCYNQTPASDTYVTSVTSYSMEHPDGVVQYMNAGMALGVDPGSYMVCQDTEPWSVRPAYNFIIDNGDGSYSAEHINLDPTAQHWLPIEVEAAKFSVKSVNDDGVLADHSYGFGEIVSLVFPVDMPVSNINGYVYLFDGYDDLNKSLIFTSSLDLDADIPANTPVLVRTYGGAILNQDLSDAAIVPMTEDNYYEMENVRHLASYHRNVLPTEKTVEDGEYVVYYLLNCEKDNMKAILTKENADNADQLTSYFRLPYISDTATQSELNVVLAEDRELKTSRIVERDIFSIPYGTIEDIEWQRVAHLNNPENTNVFYGNDVTKDIYANISAYDFLYIHGAPGQKYQFYFNGSEPTDVVIDGDGDAFIDLDEHRVGIGDVFLRGIRLAEGETVPDDAFAKLYKYLDEGLVLYGYGDFADELKGYPFYDATGVQCGITLNLDNPNAMVVGGPNVKGVQNRIVKSSEVMQGFTAESLALTDGGDFCYDYSVKCPEVTFTRGEISAGTRYVTFVLPFAAKVEKGMHEYVDCDGKNVYFNTPESGYIDAYLPIVIDMEEYESNTITITGEDFVALSPNGVFNVAPAPSSKYDMRYGFVTRHQEKVPLDNSELADYNIYCYSLKSYKFVRAVNTITLNPFRAFFMLPKSTVARVKGFAAPEEEVEALDIVLDGEEIDDVSGIGTISTDIDIEGADTYNILGIPVGPDYRGLVIRNGKKVIIK